MVTDDQMQQLASQIATEFDAEKVVLFGSYAAGTADEQSDVDLLVILPLRGTAQEMRSRIRRVVHPSFPIDIVVRSPQDVVRRYDEWDPLIRDALDRGKVLYERDGEGVDRQSSTRLRNRGTRAAG